MIIEFLSGNALNRGAITISGKLVSDAKKYQENEVKRKVTESKK
jgi:hypothetical protein